MAQKKVELAALSKELYDDALQLLDIAEGIDNPEMQKRLLKIAEGLGRGGHAVADFAVKVKG